LGIIESLALLRFDTRTVQPVASHCTDFAIPAQYSSVVFSKSDMIRIGEMAKMRYLRLLLGLTDLKKNGNTMRQCISYLKTSRKFMIQLGGRSCIIFSLSLLSP
jgi:hypothetical protein